MYMRLVREFRDNRFTFNDNRTHIHVTTIRPHWHRMRILEFQFSNYLPWKCVSLTKRLHKLTTLFHVLYILMKYLQWNLNIRGIYKISKNVHWSRYSCNIQKLLQYTTESPSLNFRTHMMKYGTKFINNHGTAIFLPLWSDYHGDMKRPRIILHYHCC
jgi:hypothetical protein